MFERASRCSPLKRACLSPNFYAVECHDRIDLIDTPMTLVNRSMPAGPLSRLHRESFDFIQPPILISRVIAAFSPDNRRLSSAFSPLYRRFIAA
jgi:hypothetical protein